MVSSCNMQKNVNMTIKDGLKRINDLVDLAAKNHSLAKRKEVFHQTILVMAEEGRQDRRKIRERAQG